MLRCIVQPISRQRLGVSLATTWRGDDFLISRTSFCIITGSRKHKRVTNDLWGIKRGPRPGNRSPGTGSIIASYGTEVINEALSDYS